MLWPKNHLCYLRPVGEADMAAGGPRAPLSRGSGLCIHVEVYWNVGEQLPGRIFLCK